MSSLLALPNTDFSYVASQCKGNNSTIFYLRFQYKVWKRVSDIACTCNIIKISLTAYQ